jgi:hypothetical protein
MHELMLSVSGAGALFSGSAIMEWLLANVSGVKSEKDAEMLGQMLLDSEQIFHTEGSRCACV